MIELFILIFLIANGFFLTLNVLVLMANVEMLKVTKDALDTLSELAKEIIKRLIR